MHAIFVLYDLFTKDFQTFTILVGMVDRSSDFYSSTHEFTNVFPHQSEYVRQFAKVFFANVDFSYLSKFRVAKVFHHTVNYFGGRVRTCMTGDKILLLVKPAINPAVNVVVTCGLGSGCVLLLSQEIDKAINKIYPYC